MGKNSKIAWTHHTLNWWFGCAPVSPGCTNCYAREQFDYRWGKAKWGKGEPRVLTSERSRNQVFRWDREAEEAGERHRVFCSSLSDVFDDEVDPEWRVALWNAIRECRSLDFLVLTKRPQNVRGMLPPEWPGSFRHVWLGVTAEDQQRWRVRVPELLGIRARGHFVSMEPLLGSIDPEAESICNECGSRKFDYGTSDNSCGYCGSGSGEYGSHDPWLRPDWLIVGGESGRDARPMPLMWAREVRDRREDSAFFFKQTGSAATGKPSDAGADPSRWPKDLRIRELPVGLRGEDPWR